MGNIKQANIETYEYAKKLLFASEVVVFPTETVYGLGANALDTKAVEKIFILKNRPSNNPLIVHVGEKSEIQKYAIISNSIEEKIIEKLMPGSITVLLKKKENIPSVISQNPYVGIRIPSNRVALEFLRHVNLPIAAPSANISTKPSPTSAQMVKEYFDEKVQLIIDGGDCSVGIESTVVKVDELFVHPITGDSNGEVFYKIVIHRPGFVTKEDFETLFSDNQNVFVEYSSDISNFSPGNMYKHYSPNASIKIIENLEEIGNISNNIENKKIALILTKETVEKYQNIISGLSKNIKVLFRGSQKNLIVCAQNLFKLYHQCDQEGIDLVFIEGLKEEGLGFSIMNRVKKSAGS
ncbi:MAG TPA: L-threonylcarbamoyladenylate synthase [Candidatus Absconditabacterales bacterium]|nr:L-threonylcarbamoyladenylate synthase [Candidatus Absconditabacterales bacterium]HOQ79272.1 L-threonylcarbamoyladenylate synthase [Candidatus Absconditabacterales bacterium]HPK28199.1 L-threonylcarbamoyladenylate synthase [Candidatus Absconditabacterales bacterium]